MQKKMGKPLKFMAFNVEEFKGKNVENIPYSERLKILKEIKKSIPIDIVDYVTTPGGKKALVQAIWAGRDLRTKEGVVAWPVAGGPPTRIPVKMREDVIVKSIFPVNPKAKVKKNMAGGFWYALENDPDKIVGKVGTGFSDKEREEMWKNRKKYIGRVAIVETKPPFETGVLRTPAFKGWHLDKFYAIDKNAFMYVPITTLHTARMFDKIAKEILR